MLRESVRRGMYADAIGREDEWLNDRIQNRTKFQSHYEADLGNGKWHSVSMHPTDLGGFVVTRADISERKKAEAAEREATALLQKVLDACPVPTRMSSIDGQDALSQSCQPSAVRRSPASRRTTMSTRTTAIRWSTPLLENGRIDDFRVRMHAADGRHLLGFHFGAPDRLPGKAGDRLQHHQHQRPDRRPGADPASQ